jgi:hypothetical protein
VHIKDTLYKIKLYSFLFLLGIILFSCSKDSIEAEVPAYISVPSITLTTDYAKEGSASSIITDAWVYVNDDLVGVYELPAKFPVLKYGNVSVKVFAGIRDNGISASRVRYLMYDPHVESVNLIEGETVEIVADVVYNDGVDFVWFEDFEGASTSFIYTEGRDTIFNKQSSTVKEGQYAGQVYLEGEMNFFEATSVPFNSALLIGNTYLELDFKTNENLFIGVYLDDEQFAHITLNPNDDWKKIYLNLKDVINSKTNPSFIKVFIGLKEEGETTFVTTNPQVYIDNLKLVHF